MQLVSQVMTRNVSFVSPQESLQRAAQLMHELEVDALPVCDGNRLVAMVMEQDIAVRSAAGEAHVDEVMRTGVQWCYEDQALDEVMTQMAESQVRQIPVVSDDDEHRLLGIVALGNANVLATDAVPVARQPIGRTPATGTDSGNAAVPGSGRGGMGNRGVAGIGVAGGSETAAGKEHPAPASGDPNQLGPAGDYSR